MGKDKKASDTINKFPFTDAPLMWPIVLETNPTLDFDPNLPVGERGEVPASPVRFVLDGSPNDMPETVKAWVKDWLIEAVTHVTWYAYETATAEELLQTRRNLMLAFQSSQTRTDINSSSSRLLAGRDRDWFRAQVDAAVVRHAEEAVEHILYQFAIYQADITQLPYNKTSDNVELLQLLQDYALDLAALAKVNVVQVGSHIDSAIDDIKLDLRCADARLAVVTHIQRIAKVGDKRDQISASVRALSVNTRHKEDWLELVSPNLPQSAQEYAQLLWRSKPDAPVPRLA